MNNLLGVCSNESMLFPNFWQRFMGVGGSNGWTSSCSFSTDVLGSQEWNLEGSESLSGASDFNFSDALRISAGVPAKVPQALRNIACRKSLYSEIIKIQLTITKWIQPIKSARRKNNKQILRVTWKYLKFDMYHGACIIL